MGAVHLGRLQLHWCDSCNLPILEIKSCGKCGGPARKVAVTPPGDIRPAFQYDIDLVRRIVNDQFGDGCGPSLVPDNRLVLLNKCPSVDRMDEVILDGQVVAVLTYDLEKGFKVLLKPLGARMIQEKVKSNWVVVDRGAVESIKKGSNAMAIGITGADGNLMEGNETIVYTYHEGQDINDLTQDEFDIELLAVGTSKMSWTNLQNPFRKGVGVKIRSVVDETVEKKELGTIQKWQDAVDANKSIIGSRRSEACKFIKSLSWKFPGKEIAVSFSGGKDSLATLLLSLEAGLKPKVLFVDTGLEFQETVEHVKSIAKEFGLTLLTESAGDSFWNNLKYFGPPGKDYRWCCKVCKLGPTSKLIQKNFPDGVVSLIGQRRYESEQRSAKGQVWHNQWVKEQIGASPIQNWTALHVWLYLMEKGVKCNPWYERGLERIGCYMCPATDMGEIAIVSKEYPEYNRWQGFLDDYYSGYEEDWVKYGLWRWRKVPEGLRILAESIKKPDSSENKANLKVISDITFRLADGYQPCEDGVSAEGVFDQVLDIERVANMLNIMGEVKLEDDKSYCTVNGITVFKEGAVVIKDVNIESVRKKASIVYEIVARTMKCVGCDVCVSRCQMNALKVDGKIKIIESLCKHCGECLGPCTAMDYGSSWEFWVGENVRD